MKTRRGSAGKQETEARRGGTPPEAKSFRRDILDGIPESTTCFHRFAGRARRYLKRKSFRRDILAGYLENSSFVFIDLDRKRKFEVYTLYYIVNIVINC
jgi:hypothetical protein